MIDGIYANGNGPNNELSINSWRKPNPNMILEASSTFNIDLKNSIIIGDRITDILSGYKAGINILKFCATKTGFKLSTKNNFSLLIPVDCLDIT